VPYGNDNRMNDINTVQRQRQQMMAAYQQAMRNRQLGRGWRGGGGRFR
jgi:hypothetical protein